MAAQWSQMDEGARIDAIARIWNRGMSASEIASHLPGSTRNAVIGFYRRHAVALADYPLRARVGSTGKRQAPGRPRAHRRVNAIKASGPVFGLSSNAGMAQETARARPIVCEPVALRKPLLATEAGDCMYSVDTAFDGNRIEHLFCGARADGPWCSYHRQLVYGVGTRSERDAHIVRRSLMGPRPL